MVFDTNPKLPDYVISQYEQAARQYCSMLMVSADMQDPMSSDYVSPMWWRFAREMAMHHLMVQCMRNYGHGVTI